jgi:cytochrome P450
MTGPHTVDFEPLDPTLANSYHEVSAGIRDRCPVAWSTGHWSEKDTGFWLVTGFPEVYEASLDHRRFSSQQGATPVQYDVDLLRLIPLENDPPLHKRLRLKINPFFTPAAINAVEHDVARIVEEILEDCLAQDPCDLVGAFATVLPPRAFFELFLDQDPKDLGHVFELVDIMQTQPERALEVVPQILGWCSGLLEQARADGRRDDLVGTIAHTGPEYGDQDIPLTEAERVQMMYLMVVAGIDTTQSALGGIFHELARDPALRKQVADLDDDGLALAVEELLRYTSPVTLAGRTVVENLELGGCPMAKGDRVNVNWTSANRDPRVFPEPGRLDLTRANARRHVAFGAGIHACLGKDLARREIRLSVRAVAKLSRFELAEPDATPYRSGFTRGPLLLPVHLAR